MSNAYAHLIEKAIRCDELTKQLDALKSELSAKDARCAELEQKLAEANEKLEKLDAMYVGCKAYADYHDHVNRILRDQRNYSLKQWHDKNDRNFNSVEQKIAACDEEIEASLSKHTPKSTELQSSGKGENEL